MRAEAEESRRRRHRQRLLFDRVAELYDASRRGYPDELVDFMVSTAGLGPGAAVLEVGCGTGQLTEQLARRDFAVTALDIGPSMVETARRRLAGSNVRFEVCAFEEFTAPESSFELIVCATAWHWLDPDVRFEKAARLLCPGGWLALLSTGERYDDPFGAALLNLWIDRSDDGGAWATQRKLSDAEIIAASALFDIPIHETHSERLQLRREAVVGLENTRATALSWDDDKRQRFNEELARALEPHGEVGVTQETALTMARALPVRSLPDG